MEKGIIPVLFIHTGNQDYLQYTVAQAEKTNSNVFLLGDESNQKTAQKWVCMEEYFTERYVRFTENYVHMSSNPYVFELNCFRRFFVSYEFAIRNNIREFMMLDSDLLAFVNFSDIDFQGCDAAFSMPYDQSNYIWTASPHCSYWTIDALDDFLNYLTYAYNEGISQLEEKWKYNHDNHMPGGICDMTLLYLWAQSDSGFHIYNTAQIRNNAVFDHFLSVSEGYRQGDFQRNRYCEMKKLKFEQGIPYFLYKDGQWIRTYTIHAQGRSKLYIPTLYNQSTGNFPYVKVKTNDYLHRVNRKLKKILHTKGI